MDPKNPIPREEVEAKLKKLGKSAIEELRRRGMTDAEINASLARRYRREKKRGG